MKIKKLSMLLKVNAHVVKNTYHQFKNLKFALNMLLLQLLVAKV